jgi:hypothetical protein
MNCTYHPILTPRILEAFQSVMMVVRNNREGIHNVALDTGNDVVGVRDIVPNSRASLICAYYECLLGAGNQQRTLLER